MADEIELKAKNDHDLLVMAVMQGNEQVRHLEQINGTLKNHDKRISTLELGGCSAEPSNNTLRKKAAISGGLFALGSLIGGAVYAFGQSVGWW